MEKTEDKQDKAKRKNIYDEGHHGSALLVENWTEFQKRREIIQNKHLTVNMGC